MSVVFARWLIPAVGLVAALSGWVLASPGGQVAVQWQLGGEVVRVLHGWLYLTIIIVGYVVLWAAMTRACRAARLGPVAALYTGLGVVLGAHMEVILANGAAVSAEAATNPAAWDGPLLAGLGGLLTGAAAAAVLQVRARSGEPA